MTLGSVGEVNFLYHQNICIELLKTGGKLTTTSWNWVSLTLPILSFLFLWVGFVSVGGKQTDCYLITKEFILKT
jgi:hypothetical protein